ncbi:MAG: PP2C family protein-serine/threonine phosphatase [Kangiellaceae bacterium]|jgi:serine/threonine protein phosphatase PrpC|nr:PP2C family protein-serine/threonine phosphatase [Kangiellaceae bacterium]
MFLKTLTHQIFGTPNKVTQWQGFNVAHVSYQGSRKFNEDTIAFRCFDNGIVAVICDGLGLNGEGQQVSQVFTDSLMQQISVQNDNLVENPELVLNQLIYSAASDMTRQLKQSFSDSIAHTTCLVVWVSKQGTKVAHIGDTRAVAMRKSEVLWKTLPATNDPDNPFRETLQKQLQAGDQITVDHSVSFVDEDVLNPDSKTINYQHCPYPVLESFTALENGDAILLSSDGFWEMISEAEMTKLTTTRQLYNCLQRLARRAVKRAGLKSDNVSALVIRKD